MGERQYLVTSQELAAAVDKAVEESEGAGIPFAQKGAAGGVATLDGEGHLTLTQVPPPVVSSSGATVPLVTTGGTKIINVPPWEPGVLYPAGFEVREQGAKLARKTEGTSEASFVLDHTQWEVVGGIPTNCVWLQDPTLTGTIADKTGVVAADAVLGAAIARVAAMTHKLPISAEPGTYNIEDWHTYFNGHICLVAPPGAPLESVIFHLTTKWERAKVVALPKATAAKGATTLELKEVHGTFAPASGGSPQPVIIEGLGAFTYTGITGGGESVSLTGLSPALPTEVKASFTSVVQGVGMYFDNAASNGVEVTIGAGVLISGPKTGSLSEWGTETPPEEGSGVWLGRDVVMGGAVKGFVFGGVLNGDHQRFLETCRIHENYSGVCWDWPYVTRDSQYFEPGCNFGENRWAGCYCTSKNEITGVSGEVYLGLNPWGVWKEKTEGVAGAITNLINLSTVNLCLENVGLGGIGCPDYLSVIKSSTLTMVGVFQLGSAKPPALPVVAQFACKAEAVILKSMFNTNVFTGFSGAPFIKSDKFLVSCPENTLQAFGAGSWEKVAATKPRIEIAFTNGAVLTTNSNTIKEHELVSYRNAVEGGLELFGTTTGVYAPTGLTAGPSEEYCVPVLYTGIPITVAVREQSTPPTSVAAEKNATAGTLEAITYYFKIVGIAAGGGVSGASAEVSVLAEAGKSVKLTWKAPAEQHAQKWTKYRVYIGTTAGGEEGYIEVGEVLELIWSGAAKTGLTKPGTINAGVEIYGTNPVRGYGTSAPGKVCVASGSTWEPGVFGKTFASPDNGVTASLIQIVPRLG